MKNKAIFLFGLPCSGKSNWYNDNKHNYEGFHYVNADHLKFSLKGYDPTVIGMYKDEGISLAKEHVLKHIKNGENFIMDAGGINSNYTPLLMKTAKESNFTITLVHIDTPYEICIERNKLRERKVPENLILDKAVKINYHLHQLLFKGFVDDYIKSSYFYRENLFFDMDGVLAAQIGLPVVNGKIDFVNSKYFRHLPIVEPVAHKLESYNPNNLYILSAAPTSISAKEKFSWLKDNFPMIKQDNIFFVNQGKYKAEMFSDLSQKLKLLKQSMCLIEDTFDIIKEVHRNYKMDAVHVSEFLTEIF